MARTNCRMEPRSIPAPRPARMVQVAALRLRLPLKALHKPGAPPRARPEDPRDESVTAVYSAAGRPHSLDGRRPPGGLGPVPPPADLRPHSGGFPPDRATTYL